MGEAGELTEETRPKNRLGNVFWAPAIAAKVRCLCVHDPARAASSRRTHRHLVTYWVRVTAAQVEGLGTHGSGGCVAGVPRPVQRRH